MQRIPEPLLMTDKDQCSEHVTAHDFRTPVRQGFVEWVFATTPMYGKIADLGCANGEVLIDMCRADYDVKPRPIRHAAIKFNIVGFEGSSLMLEYANLAISHNNLQSRITTENLLFENITQNDFDVTISSLTLHHQHNPLTFWDTVKRITKPSGRVCVMDIIRPSTESDVDQMVKNNAGDQSEPYQQNYKNSLMAAFSLAEIQQQLEASGLGHLKMGTIPNGELVLIYGKI